MTTRKREIGVIFREEFRRQTSRVGYRVFTLIVPVALLIALAVVPVVRSLTGGGEEEVERFGVLDFPGVLTALGEVPGMERFDSPEGGLEALRAGEIEALFIVSPSYYETGRVDWYRGGGALFAGEGWGDRFRSVLSTALVVERVEPSVLERVNEPAVYLEFRLDDDGVPVPDTKSAAQEAAEFFVPYIFAILLMVSIFSGSGYLLQSVAEEKENRMIEMIVTSVSPFSIMTGKVLALGAAGLIQVLVWFASALLIGPFIMDQLPNAGELPLEPTVIVPVLFYFVAGYFLYSVIMAGVGAATSSVREATQYSAIIAIPNVVAIYGSPLIVDSPNGAFARILTYIPFTSPTAMMLRLGSGDIPVGDIAGGLAVTVLAGLGLLWLAARVFRAGLLLYGQRMSPASIWRAVRQAG